jgi:hypothetical protein
MVEMLTVFAMQNVAYWPIATFQDSAPNGRFRGYSDRAD